MEYTVKQLSQMAGVSARTLRYYDQIGLLQPRRSKASGYRIYGNAEVDALQQILFYRSMGMELAQIGALIHNPGFDRLRALECHIAALLEKRAHIDLLLDNAKKTIAHLRGEHNMENNEKFEGFKQKLVEENEKNYGKEIRSSYGDEAMNRSNEAMMKLTPEEYRHWQSLGEQILEVLASAVKTGDPAGRLAQEACQLHKQWLSLSGVPYSPQYHRSLGQMYAADPRFAAYYDAAATGAARFLCDAIEIYCK